MSDLRSILIFLLLLPAISLAQTIHVNKEGEINYKGVIGIQGESKNDFYQKAKNILLTYVNPNTDSLIEKKEKQEIRTSGEVNISTSYQSIRKFRFQMKLQSNEQGIGYEIDNVQLIAGERGKKPKTIPSPALVKGMEESGTVAKETEKTLNAIDMHIQKLIAVIQSQASK